MAEFYRKRFGVKIGDRCRIVDRRIDLFGTEPYLITLGENVTLSKNVSLITHDGGVGIFRDEMPGINLFGRIDIRDNTFIGINTVILPGVEIGPNTVIGAGSLVTRNIPAEVVAAGVPARVLGDIEDYKIKAKNKGVRITTTDKQRRIKEILRSVDDGVN
ncbi:MAG: acyltransferase [Gammaproteobacteria bacterium]|nr:acyltransferase [Gammaproteobacteria bacterium]